MSDIERRYTLNPAEARTRGDKRTIGGYAAVFNKLSQNLGGFVERADPSAFNKSRGDGWPDVVARYNHDDNMMLGRTSSGTLRLTLDDVGLDYEVDPPSHRADVFELVERQDVTQSSFAFRMFNEGDDWSMTDLGYPLRTLMSVQLVDVAPVNLPAYLDTSVGARGAEVALRSLAVRMDAELEDVIALAHDGELRRLFIRTDGTAPRKLWGAALLAEHEAKYATELEL